MDEQKNCALRQPEDAGDLTSERQTPLIVVRREWCITVWVRVSRGRTGDFPGPENGYAGQRYGCMLQEEIPGWCNTEGKLKEKYLRSSSIHLIYGYFPVPVAWRLLARLYVMMPWEWPFGIFLADIRWCVLGSIRQSKKIKRCTCKLLSRRKIFMPRFMFIANVQATI